MGRQLVALVADNPETTLSGAIDRSDSPALGQDAGVLAGLSEPLGVRLTDDLAAGLDGADVVIDFSLPEPGMALLSQCERAGVPLVVGTTGLGDAHRAAHARAAQTLPMVVAANYGVGVNVLWALAKRAVELAGPEFDLEIVEMHHHHKVDSPSGTALRLAEVVAEARGLDSGSQVHGRSGIVGARTPSEIGMHALRGGDVIGEHTLVLAGPGERLELTHRAHNREIFARGAVRAALWVCGRPAGLYDMAAVLGL